MNSANDCEKSGHVPGQPKEEHICYGSIHCSEQTCYGGINALVIRCVNCGTLLEDHDYAPTVGPGKRMQ